MLCQHNLSSTVSKYTCRQDALVANDKTQKQSKYSTMLAGLTTTLHLFLLTKFADRAHFYEQTQKKTNTY